MRPAKIFREKSYSAGYYRFRNETGHDLFLVRQCDSEMYVNFVSKHEPGENLPEFMRSRKIIGFEFANDYDEIRQKVWENYDGILYSAANFIKEMEL